MAIIDNIRKALGLNTEKKQSGSVMGYFGVGSGDRSYKYQDLAKEGYLENAIVFRCVNEIAKGASSVGYMVKSGDQVLDKHPLSAILDRPNPLQSNSEFFNSLFGYLMLSGNAYVLRVGPTNGAPTELHLLRPDRITIKGGKNYIPERYDYMINGRVERSYEVDQENGFSEIKHIKLWNPLDDFYGCSPLSAAAVEIDQHNLASKHNVNLLNNGARPSGAVVFKPKDDQGFSVNLTDSQRQQLMTDLNNRFAGTSNAGRPLLLEGDFDWKEMGLSPKDMDFINLKHLSATDIALCFGVPSQLVGVPDAQTYANVSEARLALYEETIIPYLTKIQSDLNEWLVPMFGEDLEFKYDIDSIPALTERRKRIYDNVTNAVKEGIITRNEARERLGLSPMQGGDELYISANLFPLGSEPLPPPSQDDDEKDYDELLLDEKAPDPDDPRYGGGPDVFDNVADAEERAKELGCEGHHTLRSPDGRFFMPCQSHATWMRVTGSDKTWDWDDLTSKALEDIDLTPTKGMQREAVQALEWRKEYSRGGTIVGVTRANQLKNRETLSPDTVKRMFSFFSRHEVDKQAEGFRRGEDGFPSAGRVAWGLWGGDAGFTWSRMKVAQINRELEKELEFDEHIQVKEDKAEVSAKIKEALKNKVKEHNEDVGAVASKRTNLRTLEAVFRRGVGAYRTNPSSVRPTVTGPDQWGLGRVNSFLRVLRTGKFKSGAHDTDLLPKGHPKSSKK